MMPMLRDLEAVQNQPLPVEPVAKLRAANAKIVAGELIPTYRALLFPDDDDG